MLTFMMVMFGMVLVGVVALFVLNYRETIRIEKSRINRLDKEIQEILTELEALDAELEEVLPEDLEPEAVEEYWNAKKRD